jgi:hypothetical protein
MRTYAKVKAFTRGILDDAGYPQVNVYRGPELQDDDPNTYVLLTRYGGAGFDADGVLDVIGWQVRIVGGQYDYDIAEGVADAIDIAFISHASGEIEGLHVVEIARVGGAPSVLMVDDANRHHFVCSYLASVESALAS